jgi:hypothetical protein
MPLALWCLIWGALAPRTEERRLPCCQLIEKGRCRRGPAAALQIIGRTRKQPLVVDLNCAGDLRRVLYFVASPKPRQPKMPANGLNRPRWGPVPASTSTTLDDVAATDAHLSMKANFSPMVRIVHAGFADDSDKLFDWVRIERRLAVVVSFPQPFRVLGIAPCRLTSSAQPLEHGLAPPHTLGTVSLCGGAQTARLAARPTSPTRARGKGAPIS